MSSNPHLKPPLPVQIGPYAGTLRIHRDERGVSWIDDSNIKVIEVVLDHVQGWSPEKIHEQYPHLSLAQIYAAIAYYYDHTQEIDDLMREWRGLYEEAYAHPENVAWRHKMRERRNIRKKMRTGLEAGNVCSQMNLPQLLDTITATEWFSKVGTHPGTNDCLAITNLLVPEVSEAWHRFPTSRDEPDPLYFPPLKLTAKQQGKEAEAKEATLAVYKAALISLCKVNEDVPLLTFNPHSFVFAAKGGALYAARQSAVEAVVGEASCWRSLISLYSEGYWPCGYTESGRVVVY